MNSDPNRMNAPALHQDWYRRPEHAFHPGAFVINMTDDSIDAGIEAIETAAREVWNSIQDFVGVPDRDWRPYHRMVADAVSSRVTEPRSGFDQFADKLMAAQGRVINRACPQCSRDRGREHGTPCGALACPYRGGF